MTARKAKTTDTPVAAGITFTRTTASPDLFKARRRGGARGSRFSIDPALQDALAWTTESAENVLSLPLSTFPNARTRTEKGQPMTEGPATVDSARAFLDLHAEPIGLGVKVRLDDSGENVLVIARKRVVRPRKSV